MQKHVFPEGPHGDIRCHVSSLSPPQNSERLLALTRQWLPRVSRSFAPSIALLEPRMEAPVGLAYLCCRILDTLEDSTLPVEQKKRHLLTCLSIFHGKQAPREFLDELRSSRAFEEDSDGALLLNLEAVLLEVNDLSQATRDILLQCLDEMGEGMIDMMDHAELKSEDELFRYCHIVAGTVGTFLTGLYLQQVSIPAPQTQTLIAHSENFAQGLQRVNIAADVGKDMTRKVQFIPRLIEKTTPSLSRHLTFCRDTLQFLEGGLEYILAIRPADAYRSFCALPLLLAGKTLCRVAGHPDVFSKNGAPRVPREETMQLILFCRDFAQDDQALRSAFAEFTGPLRELA